MIVILSTNNNEIIVVLGWYKAGTAAKGEREFQTVVGQFSTKIRMMKANAAQYAGGNFGFAY